MDGTRKRFESGMNVAATRWSFNKDKE